MTLREVLDWLRRRGTRRNVAGMARYGIVAPNAFGVSMKTMQALAKRIGKDHALAGALWKSGWFEARMLATLVDDPGRVTGPQMDAWACDFDNWAICDTACFCLFDRTPHAWRKVRQWASSPREFVRRAAFALLASLAGHDKSAPDAKFLALQPRIERGACDERPFVRKGVSWALRRIGGRSPALHAASVELATRLARSDDASSRWVGRDVLRDLTRPMIRARLARVARARAGRGRRASRA